MFLFINMPYTCVFLFIGISSESSENDVLLWLKTEVGLEDNVFEKYDNLYELNGRTLFSYRGDGARAAFTSETRVPMRIAIRILCIRERIHEKISSPLLKLTSEEISEFLKGIFAKSESTCVKMLCAQIIKWNIDGLIFYNYQDEKEFQYDFNDLDIDGIYFRKAIIMRNERFKIPSYTYTSFCDEKKEVQKPLNLSKSITIENNSKVQHPVQEECFNQLEAKKYKTLLCSMLSLHDIKECDFCKPCIFNIIYGSWKNHNNEFEKKFVFFLVCEEDEFKEKAQQKNLWKKIISNQHLWLNNLSLEQRNTFNGKSGMPKNQCKLAYVMEKDWESIRKFDCGILLTTKNIFGSKERCFVANLAKTSASPQQFYFAFRTLETYFVFDPENDSYEFKRQKINDVNNEFQCMEGDECSSQNLSVEVGSEGNREIENVSLLNYQTTNTKQTEIQYPRRFKGCAENVKYKLGHIFPQPESGGKLFLRCFEYKSFFSCLRNKKENRFVKFQTEIIRFASACLNSRKNGTICFGVADSVNIIDGKEYKHGEIVGCEITEIDSDTKNAYTESLQKVFLNSEVFYPEMADPASRCISEPIFVEVEMPWKSVPRYVIEVDVEAASKICKTFYFKVNLKKIKNQVKDVKNEYVLLRRSCSSTEKLVDTAEKHFIQFELEEIIALRKKFDDEPEPMLCDNCEKELKKEEYRANAVSHSLSFPILKPEDP